jgi:hypothetical protein
MAGGVDCGGKWRDNVVAVCVYRRAGWMHRVSPRHGDDRCVTACMAVGGDSGRGGHTA